MDEKKQDCTKDYIIALALTVFAGVIIIGGSTLMSSRIIGGAQSCPPPNQAESQPAPQVMSTGEIGVIDIDRVMREHPLIKEGEPIAQERFKAAEEEINKLPEQERAMAWQTKNEEIMRDMQEKYVNPARKEIDETVNKVLDQNGIKTCLINTNLFRGGVDITDDVIARLQK